VRSRAWEGTVGVIRGETKREGNLLYQRGKWGRKLRGGIGTSITQEKNILTCLVLNLNYPYLAKAAELVF
jgi:hypothetical protein